jgi:hypothetical protein
MVPPYLLIFAVVLAISALGGWLATRRRKKKLEEGLGRSVNDEEITSISAWMKADDKVVNEVVQDDSLQSKVENIMEDAVSIYGNDR